MPFLRNVACGIIDFVVLWSTNKDNNTFHHEWLACCAAVLQQALRCSTKSVRDCCFPSDGPVHLDHAWTEALSHALKRANVMFVHLFPLEENPETSNFSLATGMTTSTLLPCHIFWMMCCHTLSTLFFVWCVRFFVVDISNPHGDTQSFQLRAYNWTSLGFAPSAAVVRALVAPTLQQPLSYDGRGKKARLDETRRSLTRSRQPATNHDEEGAWPTITKSAMLEGTLHQASNVACEKKKEALFTCTADLSGCRLVGPVPK